ncbi:MAG: hypothetical protein ISS41_11790 [Candidatus Aminicenantes bacterium]|nr:hypothetical protein [Candidatus Aminicenantes bacterium]
MKVWREKSERERNHPRILSDYYPNKMEEDYLVFSALAMSLSVAKPNPNPTRLRPSP